MSELILGAVVLILLGYHIWYVVETNRQTREYMKGFMAKNLPEFIEAKKTEEVKPEEEEEHLVEMNELSDKDWLKAVKE